MTTKKQEGTKDKTFRAHIWSPINKGEAILELDIGTTVEQLLNALTGLWGAQFRPSHGFAKYEPFIAGWCVLCKSNKGVFCPLGIEDNIPISPIDDKDGRHFQGNGWFHQTLSRSWHITEEASKSIINPDFFKRLILYWRSGFGERDENNRLAPGVMYTGPKALPQNRKDFEVLASGPEPKEPVDVQLALIIAVSGT